MPILSLFATTKSFLNNQTKDGNLVSDFNLVHTYDLNALTTTEEDEILFSNTNETTITTSLI
ncbi:hypothetical protein [Spiroplasma sp. AdecLV25b]|uniref:hypothetical protein n=1 Tax=Spiroplasma sp. AdecLV25b TaxID=3027162 RepID=UPI0027DFE507|nr:hypothetical protein [Spiroplasma sp. AdecLV25b]